MYKYFLPFCCFFALLVESFDAHFFVCLFHVPLVLYLRTYCQSNGTKILSCIFSKHSVGVGLTFRFATHFELTSVCGDR